jgi:hypothetical protein
VRFKWDDLQQQVDYARMLARSDVLPMLLRQTHTDRQ